QQLGLQPPQWRLLEAGARRWLALKRFDVCGQGRQHLASACALLDADFRQPSLDYHDLIKMTGQLCSSPQAATLQFRRAVFNLLASNQDDHSKNWAFLLGDDGQGSQRLFMTLLLAHTRIMSTPPPLVVLANSRLCGPCKN